jgi:hypothetical protein
MTPLYVMDGVCSREEEIRREQVVNRREGGKGPGGYCWKWTLLRPAVYIPRT